MVKHFIPIRNIANNLISFRLNEITQKKEVNLVQNTCFIIILNGVPMVFKQTFACVFTVLTVLKILRLVSERTLNHA